MEKMRKTNVKNSNSVKSNKKGSVSVMLSMIFVCLLMVTVVLVNAATKAANYSYCDGVLQLAGKSILSEYHIALKDTYGLMAFKGYENQVKEKLKFYSEGSFKSDGTGGVFQNKDRLTMIKPKIENINCRMQYYSLMEQDVFENEILNYMRYPKLIENVGQGKKPETTGILINQRIINGLPSKGLKENNFDIQALVSVGFPSLTELKATSTNKLIVNEYVMKNFNCRFEKESEIQTFFQNELEYILYGKLSDVENQEKFINDFRTLRFILNSAHIYGDSRKMAQIMEMAEIITPGVAAAATAIVLAETWAYGETANDVKRILAGKNVAIIKNAQQWSLSLTAAIGGIAGENYVSPKLETGFSYKDYLRAFLYFENREVKLLRIMDLIQINLQGNFDESFYVKDCYTGLSYSIKINGQEYSYVQKY